MIKIYGTPEQLQVINATTRFNFLAAGRRWGKTFTSRNRIIRCMGRAGFRYCYISTSGSQLIKEYEALAEHPALKRVILRAPKHPYMRIQFVNGAEIMYRTLGGIENLRGEAFDEVWCDEIQNYSDKTYWSIIRPFVSDRKGTLFHSGQFRGENWYHDEYWKKGLDPAYPEYAAWRFKTSEGIQFQDESGRDELELLKQSMPKAVWDVECECEITANPNAVFRPEDLRRSIGGVGLSSGEPGGTYILAIDLGRIRDPSAYVVLDAKSGTVVHTETRPLGEYHERGCHEAANVRRRFNNATSVIDATGGATGGHTRDQDAYVKFYRERVPDLRPIYWTRTRKEQLITGLSLALENGQVTIPEEHVELHKQLAAYEYQMRNSGRIEYSAPKGEHDDLVAALAMAWYAKTQEWAASSGYASAGAF